MPPILSYASEWRQLHTLTMRLGLYNEAFVRDIARFLVTFHPPALEDVTVQFLVYDSNIIYATHRNDTNYINACLELQADQLTA